MPIRGREAKAFGDIPLGVDARALFTQNNIALSSGDRVLLYTDGIVEAPNNNDEPFGLQRLVQTLQATSSDQLEYVRASVLDALLEHTADSLMHDDVTFMVLEVTGETNRALRTRTDSGSTKMNEGSRP